jgi:hypothetical protein
MQPLAPGQAGTSPALKARRPADRKRVAAIDNRPAAFEKPASRLLAAGHDRPLALIEDEYRQFVS